MVKCSACQQKKCGEKFENRDMCNDPTNCTCTCQESSGDTFWKAAATIASGVGVIAGGVALTVLTGGVGGIIAGGVIIGAGGSLVTNPIGKKIAGERMNAKDLVADVAVGAVVGVASGGLGAGGSVLAKGATTAAKVGIQIAAGASSGAVSGAVFETAKAIKGEDVSVKSFAKAVGVGAVCGGVGGASGSAASAINKTISNGVAKAAVRVTTQAATAGVTDATMQVIENKGDLSKFDASRTLLQTASSATMATTAECSRNGVLRTKAYASRLNEKLISEAKSVEGNGIDKKTQQKISKQIDEMNREPSQIREELRPERLEQLEQARSDKIGARTQLKDVNQRLNKINNMRNAQFEEHTATRFLLETDKELARANLDRAQGVIDRSMMGENNLHALTEDRQGQLAFDIQGGNNNNNNQRGAHRAFVDTATVGGKQRFVYSDYTERHNYRDAARPGARPKFDHPVAPSIPNMVGLQECRDDDDDDEKLMF